MINLCLVYVIKLNFERILKIVIYISIGVAAYYIIKTLYVLIKNIRKYKKANNDIKEIIKKWGKKIWKVWPDSEEVN